jgi:hypothetical protein
MPHPQPPPPTATTTTPHVPPGEVSYLEELRARLRWAFLQRYDNNDPDKSCESTDGPAASTTTSRHTADVTPADEVITALTMDDQRRLVCELTAVVAAYGGADRSIVDPDWFAARSERLRAGSLDIGQLQVLAGECEAVIERLDDEPDGAGFYACGAVVSLYYTCLALTAHDSGAVNAVKRFLDLLGAADDDGESGIYDEALRYLHAPTRVERDALTRRVSAHAGRL